MIPLRVRCVLCWVCQEISTKNGCNRNESKAGGLAGLGFVIYGFRVQSSGFRVQGLGFGVQV